MRTYGVYRRKGNLEKALHALKNIAFWNEVSEGHVTISPQFVVFDHNKHEMPIFEDFCHSLGLNPQFKAPYLRNNTLMRDSGIPKYCQGKVSSVIKRKQNMRCCGVSKAAAILRDGFVVICCYDHNGITTYGNIFDMPFDEIWNSEAYASYRKSIASGQEPEFCMQNCLL